VQMYFGLSIYFVYFLKSSFIRSSFASLQIFFAITQPPYDYIFKQKAVVFKQPKEIAINNDKNTVNNFKENI